MTGLVRAVLIGEVNPYGVEPAYALYPLPANASGGRLQRIVLGVSRQEYLRHYARVNLCTCKWVMGVARQRAAELRTEYPQLPLVLLGQKVCSGFGLAFQAFSAVMLDGRPAIMLPHPSGLNRMWNAPDTVVRARQVLQAHGVL